MKMANFSSCQYDLLEGLNRINFPVCLRRRMPLAPECSLYRSPACRSPAARGFVDGTQAGSLICTSAHLPIALQLHRSHKLFFFSSGYISIGTILQFYLSAIALDVALDIIQVDDV